MDEVDCFSAMHANLHNFMKKGMFTDINFVIGESKIKAHKSVLASCSPVFQTMFETAMDESQSNEVTLTDVDEELFSAFLDYIYIRDVNIVEKYTQGMLMLADKYDIEPLALLCDSLIEGSLTPENAVDSLFLADLYRRDALKKEVNLFITKHLEAVSTHANWTKLDEHFDVMNGIFQSIVQGNNGGASNKKLDEVTWTASHSNWISSSWVSLMLSDYEHDVLINVMPLILNPSGFLGVHIKVENKLNESFPTTIIITLTRNSVKTMQTNSSLSWASNSTGEAKLPVVYNQMYPLSYPFKLSVAVKKTTPINQHPHLRTVKEWTRRFTDAVIVVGNVNFPVHKLVLAGRSTFFSDLFHKTQNEYRIEGMAEQTFKCLLDYMYNNCNPMAEKVDLPLLRGAETFRLNELTEYCFTTLQQRITYENAIDMFIKAEELQLNKLLTAVVEFMVKEPKTVAASLKWPAMKNHPRVMKELMYKMKR